MAGLLSLCKYEEPSESEKEHMRKCWHLEVPGLLVCNPVVFGGSVLFLWGFVIACCVEPDYMKKAMDIVAWEWIPEVWTWIYIFSQDFWVVVLAWAAIWYGNLKLGNCEPEFSTATWFSMLFCCGVATGFFWYSVAEPVWHYGSTSASWHSAKKGYGNNDEDAMMSLVITMFHWGLHGWIPYTTMGASLAIMTYRRGYPMTVRYCFFPLLGDRVYGWLGDLVDGLSIVTSIAGVCTSLGLGAMQINSGLQRLNHGFYRGTNYAVPLEEKYTTPGCNGQGTYCADGKEAYGIQQSTGSQIGIIAVITCLATISVVLGLGRGIKFLSQFVFAMGSFLLLMVLFMGETYLSLDVMVQAIGQYAWYVLKLGFHCDAWERLGKKDMGLGGDESGQMGGSGFLSGWTLFYWGWWISWGPFVGTFIAKISKGRTLRAFIVATLVVPTLYSVVWFSVWGTEGIRMQRMAKGAGLCSAAAAPARCSVASGAVGPSCAKYSASYTLEEKKSLKIGWNPSCVLDPAHHDGLGRCQQSRFTRWAVKGDECIEHTSWVTVPCGGGADPTAQSLADFTSDKGSMRFCRGKITNELQLNAMYNKFKAKDQPECFVPLSDGVVCIGGQGGGDMLYDQLSSYGPRGFSDLLCVIALICLSLYFVTSSDSGSLVVDILSANGHPEPPMLQRVFWSFTEGSTAIALLYSGVNALNANASLKALQAASIITGLPYTFILFWACQGLAILVQEEMFKETGGQKGLDPDRKAFSKFLLNGELLAKHVKNTAVPGVVMGKTVAVCGKWPFNSFGDLATQAIWTTVFSALYYLSIIVPFFGFITPQWMIVGLVFYVGFGVLLGLVRNGVRVRYGILHGDIFTDLLCGIFAPMFTVSQVEAQMLEPMDQPVEAEARDKEAEARDNDLTI